MRTHVGLSLTIALFATLRSASADDAPWSFELSTAHAGAPIYYRLAWENRADAAVRVPADLLSRVDLQLEYCPPGGCRQRARHARMLTAGRPGGPPADSVPWMVVKAGQVIERTGALNDEPCTPKGCAAGEYTVSAHVSPRSFTGAAPDQEVPSGAWERLLKTSVATIGVAADDAVSVVARFRRTPKGLRVSATVTNRLSVPMWFPRVTATFVECPTRLVAKDGSTEEQDMGTAAGGQSSYAEDEAALLAPGASVRIEAQCDVDIPAGTVHLDAGLRLVPFRPFEPIRAVPPVHFRAVARAPMVRVF